MLKSYEHLLQVYMELQNNHLKYLKRLVTAITVLMNIKRYYPHVLEECSTKEQMDDLCLKEKV